MIIQNVTRGVDDALERFGLSKEAGFGQSLKTLLVGDPSKYIKQLRQGTLLGPEGAVRKAMDPRASTPLGTVANAALMYGLPAYGVYQAATSPEGQRGSAVGSALGGVAGGLLGGPLGMAGQIGGSILGSSLGETLGRNFNRHPRQAPQMEIPTQRPLSSEMSDVTGRPS